MTTFKFCGLLLLLTATTTFGQTNPQPGATDPIGKPSRYTLFPDQSLLSFVPGAADPDLGPNPLYTRMYDYRLDAKPSLVLANNQQCNASNPAGPCVLMDRVSWDPVSNQIFAASGRIVTPNHEDVVYARRNGSNVAVSFVNGLPASSYPTVQLAGLANRQVSAGDYIAIAVGDLDKVADSNGNNHDEVAVAYMTNNNQMNVAIINYTNGGTPAIQTYPIRFANYSFPHENVVALSIGDFDNDGNNELAVSYIRQVGTAGTNGGRTIPLDQTRIAVFRYANTGTNTWSLKLAKDTQLQGASTYYRTISAQAGDFNGDGVDEVAIGYAVNLQQNQADPPTIFLQVIQLDAALNATLKAVSNFGATASASDIPHVEVASGQFLFNPPNFPFGRRQLAIAWGDTNSMKLKLQALSVADDLNSMQTLGPQLSFSSQGSNVFSLKAGGFTGNSNPSQPTASLALSYWSINPSVFNIAALAASPNGLAVNSTTSWGAGKFDATARIPLAAYDLDGKSLYLGAPVHFTVQGAVKTDFILEEPPKHAYWDNTAKIIQTITRNGANNVHFSNQQTGTFASSTKDHTNFSVGGSAALTASASFSEGLDIGLVKTTSEQSAEVTAKASYAYDQEKESINSQYNSRSLDTTGQTDNDDFVKGSAQTYDVWRYRVYGVTQTSPQSNSFYDLIVPGPTIAFGSGGLNFDWYQPIHENGNILSYPAILGDTPNDLYVPSDLGTYTLPNGSTPKEPQVPASKHYFDGTGTSYTLSYSSELSNAQSFQYSHTLGSSLDVKGSTSVTAKVGETGGSLSLSASVNFNSNTSWGGTTTSDSKTTNLTQITLNQSSGNPNFAYPFYPVVYSTTNGTVKMTFAVPNPAAHETNNNASSYWAGLYGGLPDPALNLVRRFSPQYSPANPNIATGWDPNLLPNRKHMRGLFFRKPDLDPNTKTYDLYGAADSPADGDTVRVEARVYNYSTAKSVANVPVLFQAIPYDESTDNEICATPINYRVGAPSQSHLVCPASARTIIGQTVVASLNSLQFTCLQAEDAPATTGCSASSVFVNWDTTGFGPAANASGADYRIYVTLDPGNTIPQIYGGEAPPVPITQVVNQTPLAITTATPHGFTTGDYVIIGNVAGITEANGIFQVTVQSSTQFTLNSSLNSLSNYSGGGTATILNPGQNNEGFAYFQIAPKPQTTGVGGSSNTKHRDYLLADSLQAEVDPGSMPTRQKVVAFQGRPLQLRITAFSSITHPHGAIVLLYDGDPSEGALAIASKNIHPGSNGENGSSVWLDWTPQTLGEHHLFAQLIDSDNDVKPRRSVSRLKVNVFLNGDVNRDGKIDEADVRRVRRNVGKSVEDSSCGPECDLDGDGRITTVDLQKEIALCGTAACQAQ